LKLISWWMMPDWCCATNTFSSECCRLRNAHSGSF
jgi:hypothetical protein